MRSFKINAASDERTCDFCSARDGTIVDNPHLFYMDDHARQCADPNGCRCVLSPVDVELENDEKGRPLDDEEQDPRTLPLMHPVTMSCPCGAYLQVMKLHDGWALGHLENLDSMAIVAATLEEAIAEFLARGIDHAADRPQKGRI